MDSRLESSATATPAAKPAPTPSFTPAARPAQTVDPLADIAIADNILAELEAFGMGSTSAPSGGLAPPKGTASSKDRPVSISVTALSEVDDLLAQIDSPGGFTLDDLPAGRCK